MGGRPKICLIILAKIIKPWGSNTENSVELQFLQLIDKEFCSLCGEQVLLQHKSN